MKATSSWRKFFDKDLKKNIDEPVEDRLVGIGLIYDAYIINILEVRMHT